MTDTISTETESKLVLSSAAYDFLKLMVTVWLPGAATFYLAMSEAFSLPNPSGAVALLSGLATFLGLVLRSSSKRYAEQTAAEDGAIVKSIGEDGKTLYSLEIDTDLETLDEKQALTFRVK